MKSRRIVADYLQDILDNIAKVQRFVEGVELEAFEKDEEKVYAVVRGLEIIGEAARHVPPAWRAKYPQVPWKAMAGMRDKVTHDYFGVDVQVVWKTVHKDLPGLQPDIARILAEVRALEHSEGADS